jgi:hypothetical protein
MACPRGRHAATLCPEERPREERPRRQSRRNRKRVCLRQATQIFGTSRRVEVDGNTAESSMRFNPSARPPNEINELVLMVASLVDNSQTTTNLTARSPGAAYAAEFWLLCSSSYMESRHDSRGYDRIRLVKTPRFSAWDEELLSQHGQEK